MADDEGDDKLPANLPVLRALRGCNQKTAAAQAGVAPSAFSEWENGTRAPSARNLAQLRDGLRVSAAELEFVDRLRDLARSGGLAAAPHLELHALRAGLEAVSFAREALTLAGAWSAERGAALRPAPPSAADRQEAPHLLARFLRLTAGERETLLDASLCFRKWALCEALCRESRQREDPAEARDLAHWALEVAERVSGTDWSLRLQGLATAALAHAERAAGDPARAETTLREAWKLWDAGCDEWGLLGGWDAYASRFDSAGSGDR